MEPSKKGTPYITEVTHISIRRNQMRPKHTTPVGVGEAALPTVGSGFFRGIVIFDGHVPEFTGLKDIAALEALDKF